MVFYNLTFPANSGALGILTVTNNIASGGLFMVISLLIFGIMFFYSIFRTDIGKALATASFLAIIFSIFFVALGLMQSYIMFLYTTCLIAGILLAGRGSYGLG
jgi:hypothetical protein